MNKLYTVALMVVGVFEVDVRAGSEDDAIEAARISFERANMSVIYYGDGMLNLEETEDSEPEVSVVEE
jgi:hypothetical protein